MSKPKPSKVQLDTLRRMVATDGRIYRLKGGFWITNDVRTKTVKRWDTGTTYESPDWSCDVQTIRAMERRGWVQRCNETEEYKDTRVITDAGRAVAMENA